MGLSHCSLRLCKLKDFYNKNKMLCDLLKSKQKALLFEVFPTCIKFKVNTHGLQ